MDVRDLPKWPTDLGLPSGVDAYEGESGSLHLYVPKYNKGCDYSPGGSGTSVKEAVSVMLQNICGSILFDEFPDQGKFYMEQARAAASGREMPEDAKAFFVRNAEVASEFAMKAL